jgi:hypothetical protein
MHRTGDFRLPLEGGLPLTRALKRSKNKESSVTADGLLRPHQTRTLLVCVEINAQKTRAKWYLGANEQKIHRKLPQ